MTFKNLEIAEPILKAICEKGYTQPTPIQEKGIPVALQGKDILGIAQTGTGKTAAFAIPILQHLSVTLSPEEKTFCPVRGEKSLLFPDGKSGKTCFKRSSVQKKRPIKALILTPTRELAIQIGDCFSDYGKYTGLKHTTIFGGVKQGPQTEELENGVDILIATPGRLLDLINQKFVDLNNITHFVLDEADRMLDMGFIADIKRLLPKLPARRQTLFFSATMPRDIAALAQHILTNPVRVEVTPVSSAVETIKQYLYFVEKPEKKKLLLSLLQNETGKSVLIFSRTKHGADNIARFLKKSGLQSAAIHGDKTQGQRQKALTDFKTGNIKVLVATDIAARGIDIRELEMVINYDLPDVAETYIHRIGRTGRAGHSGCALTFCTPEDKEMLSDIRKMAGKQLQTVSQEIYSFIE